MKKTSLLLSMISLILPLVGCDSSSKYPKEVFEEFNYQLALLFGNPDSVIFGDVYCAYITGTGKKDPGELLGNIYYEIPYHYNIKDVTTQPFKTYAAYYSSKNIFVENPILRDEYVHIVDCIGNKTYKGKLGFIII